MPKKIVLGESQDVLRSIPIEQLNMFVKLRLDDNIWTMLNKFVHDQKMIKMDSIYRLRRPKNQDEILRNALDHEYYASRIASLVILLQIIENAQDELERRERKEAK